MVITFSSWASAKTFCAASWREWKLRRNLVLNNPGLVSCLVTTTNDK